MGNYLKGLTSRRAGAWVLAIAAAVWAAGYWGHVGPFAQGNLGPSAQGDLLALVTPADVEEVDPHADQLKNPDGSWKYTNALIRESSPYLLLHAHNPVDWHSWGPEALERARAEDKPIFLSVGYSTC